MAKMSNYLSETDDDSTHYKTLGRGLTYFRSGIKHVRETLSGVNERVDEAMGKAFLPVYRALANNPASDEWAGRNKGTILSIVIPLTITGVAALLTYLDETRYHIGLSDIANAKLHGMDKTIGEYWKQGKMPVQLANHEIIDLGKPSICNFKPPSINLFKPSGNDLPIINFSTRDLLQSEKDVIQAFNNGAYTGLDNYEKTAIGSGAYFTGLGVSKIIGKHEQKN
jgi:hypothetical protein